MSALGDAPKRQVGSSVAGAAVSTWPNGLPGWSAFDTDRDRVPELRAPRDVEKFDQMLTNPQVWALALGMLLPIMDYDYGLEPAGADPAMTAVLAADLGLPVGLPAPGEMGPGLEPGAFSFDFLEHWWEALFSVLYGRYWFEAVGEVTPDDGVWHLEQLAPRPPHDVSDVITDDDGNLRAIMFPGVDRRRAMPVIRDVPIPATQVVSYVWLPTAKRRWLGRAMLRPMYEPWTLRDRAVRIDIVNHEKAGGVPHVETDETWQGGNLQELQQLASSFRVGQESGAALPPGAHLKLLRMGGTDVIATARYHDEVMARAWGSMVRQLGSTASGSRALGDTMMDMEAVIRRAIVRAQAGTFREQVIRRWWEWNVGPTPYPQLAWRPRDDGAVAGDPLGGGPPDPPGARSASALPGPTSGVAARRGAEYARGLTRAPSQGASTVSAAGRLPDRPLRRGLTETEVRAAVDFAAMDVAYDTGVEATERLLADAWLPDLIQQAEDAVTFTKNGTVRKRLTRLDASRIRLTPPDTTVLEDILLDAAREGAAGAGAELAAQGMIVQGPSDDELRKLVRDHARAVAQQAADGVTLAASRRAVHVNAGRSPGEVASEVADYLRGLKHRWEADQLRGAVQMATTAARLAVFDRIPDEAATAYYSSEILDASTCGPCATVDGYLFEDLEHATRMYPSGGFLDCDGGARCRGTIVAVLNEPDPVFPPGLDAG